MKSKESASTPSAAAATSSSPPSSSSSSSSQKAKAKLAMTEEHYQLLNEIGFDTLIEKQQAESNATQEESADWESKFKQIVKYKEIHGDANVPKRYQKLGKWVDAQRSAYKTFKAGTKRGRNGMNATNRIRHLEEIGFLWSTKGIYVNQYVRLAGKKKIQLERKRKRQQEKQEKLEREEMESAAVKVPTRKAKVGKMSCLFTRKRKTLFSNDSRYLCIRILYII